MPLKITCATIAVLPFLAGSALAFEMGSPVMCDLGKTCFIQQYVDHDDSSGVRDTACGPRSYDGHQGTDFRLPDQASMMRGTNVLAVAGGKVRATRDGLPDGVFNASGASPSNGRECGNGVLIDHEGGWSTQYCHLRKSSVVVRKGAAVRKGDVLGQIGQSGKAEFPHLHLTLRRGEKVVDPFDGTPMGTACQAQGQTLWSANSGIAYSPGGIMSAGFQTAVPEYTAIKARSPHGPRFSASVPALVFWAHFFGVEQGDVLASQLIDPGGKTIAEDRFKMAKNRATQFRAVGRKRPGAAWPAGVYLGRAVLLRNGKPIAEMNAKTVVR